MSLGYTSQELFGRRLVSAKRSPTIEFSFRTDLFGALCDEVNKVLHSTCMVPPPKEGNFAMDAETLKYVSALQVECKVFHARCGTQFGPNSEVANRVMRTALFLNDGLIPLAVYINQIGCFEVNNQKFVPRYNGSNDFSYGRLFDAENHARASFASLVNVQPAGMITDHQGDHMYAREEGTSEIVKRDVVNVGGQAQFACTGSVLTFNQIVARYTNLKVRVNSKLANAFAQLNLTSGLGKESQIVFRSEIGNTDDVMDVWCPRWLCKESLKFGAIFALGDPNQPLADKQVAVSECTIDTASAIMTLAHVLTRMTRHR